MFLVAHPYPSYASASVSPDHHVFLRSLNQTSTAPHYAAYGLDFNEDDQILEQLAARRFLQARRNEVARRRAIDAARLMQQRREYEYQAKISAAEEEVYRNHIAFVRAQEVAKSRYLEQLRQEEAQRILRARMANARGKNDCKSYSRHSVGPHAVHRSRANHRINHEDASARLLDLVMDGLHDNSVTARHHSSVPSRQVPPHIDEQDRFLDALLGRREVNPIEKKAAELNPHGLADLLEDAFAAFLTNDLQSPPSLAAEQKPGPHVLPTRIPSIAKGKSLARDTPITSPQVPTRPVDEHTAAQLAADAAFAAELQAEEDRLAASRRFARGPTLINGHASSASPVEVKKSDASASDVKGTSSLEDLLRARASEETDLDVLLAINKLLQQFSPVTSPVPKASAHSTPAAAAPSSTPSTSAPAISRTSSSDSLSRIANTLQDLTHAFVLPPLDFTARPATSSSASATGSTLDLAFTPANQPVHAQEAALSRLLDQLDAIEADGDNDVRARRRDLVKEVERALGEIEQAVEAQRQEHSSVSHPINPEIAVKDVADVESVEGYEVSFDVEEPFPVVVADNEALPSTPSVPSFTPAGPVDQDHLDLTPSLNASSTSADLVPAPPVHQSLGVADNSVSHDEASAVVPSLDGSAEDKVVQVSDVTTEASQPLPLSRSSPIPIASDLPLPTFPPGPSPLATVESISVPSESDLDTGSDVAGVDVASAPVDAEVDEDTFLLAASRARSPILHPNHADSSDEEGVLMAGPSSDAAKSDGEWSELESEA